MSITINYIEQLNIEINLTDSSQIHNRYEEDDRLVKDVVAHNVLFNNGDAFYLVKRATELYSEEPNLLRLRDPIIVLLIQIQQY